MLSIRSFEKIRGLGKSTSTVIANIWIPSSIIMNVVTMHAPVTDSKDELFHSGKMESVLLRQACGSAGYQLHWATNPQKDGCVMWTADLCAACRGTHLNMSL